MVNIKYTNNKLIKKNGYAMARSDRSLRRARKKKGGRLCCYVRENLKFKVIEKFNKSKYSLIDFLNGYQIFIDMELAGILRLMKYLSG